MQVDQLLQQSKKELCEISMCPYQESLWILSYILNLSCSEIYLEKTPLSPEQQEQFWSKIWRRKQGEPLEYILKTKDFFQKSFYVEPGVFIPRPETETLVRWVLNHVQQENLKAVDFGAGTGVLCLSLLSKLPKSRFVALDICKKAIKCLKKNQDMFDVEDRLNILEEDVGKVTQTKIVQILDATPSLIVANPPYIDSKDQSISREVYFYDPPLALFSDRQGMGHIISWFEKAMELLSPKGLYVFEFGWNQENQVKDFCENQKELSGYEIHTDEAKRPRMAVCFKK